MIPTARTAYNEIENAIVLKHRSWQSFYKVFAKNSGFRGKMVRC